MDEKTFQKHISDIIENNNLYGRSFTAGVALYYGIMHGGLTDAERLEFENRVEMYHEDIYEYLTERNMHANARVYAEMLDISELHEICAEMAGEATE